MKQEGHYKDRFAELMRDAVPLSDVTLSIGSPSIHSTLAFDPQENPSL
jgi:hypothetical protein